MFRLSLLVFLILSHIFVPDLLAMAPNVASTFEVHGHRGARARRPENTLQAFQFAIESGVTALEMDLGVTKDGELVLNHDLTVNTDLCFSRKPGLSQLRKPLIHDLRLSEIKSYDCGSILNPLFPFQALVPGAKILSFRELLVFLKKSTDPRSKKVKINIETKTDPENPASTLGPEAFVDLVAKLILDEGFDPRRVILQSFDFRTIIYAKAKWPSLKTSALVESLDSSLSSSEAVRELLIKTQADYISPNGHVCSKALVSEAHALGRKVLVWTINKKRDWRHFARMGVDGIITDDPGPLVQDLLKL
ncbi:MAG: glycerophosphodiester phosphodiesterase family protein [Bdellovibrionota bacterium]